MGNEAVKQYMLQTAKTHPTRTDGKEASLSDEYHASTSTLFFSEGLEQADFTNSRIEDSKRVGQQESQTARGEQTLGRKPL